MEYTIALLSDIHGNFEALGTCLSYIRSRKTDHIVLLGDMITDGPCPDKTMDMIYDLMKNYRTTVIRGNREEYLLDCYKDLKSKKITQIPFQKNTPSSGSLYYTYERLREEDYLFFDSLPNHTILSIPHFFDITIMHGSQFQVRDNYMEEPQKGLYSMEMAETPILFGGHSHHQELKKHAGKYYINPGSVGFAIDGVGKRAQMAFLTLSDSESFSFEESTLNWPFSVDKTTFCIESASCADRKEACTEQTASDTNQTTFALVELLSLPYDFEAYKKAMLNSHLPQYSLEQPLFCLLSLEYGINYFFKGTKEITKRSGKSPVFAPKECWTKVYEHFFKQSKELHYSNKKLAECYVKYPLEAVVFDMDGVLFDTENLIANSWDYVSKKHNIIGMREVFYQCIGVNLTETLKIIEKHYGKEFPYEEYREEARAYTKAYIEEHGLPVKPYVKETLAYLKKHKVKIGLASSTAKEKIIKELTDTGLIDYFAYMIGGDECKKSKPEPDIYLMACEGLHVNPKHCIAIEDSHNGIRAAFAAGMMPVMIPDLLPENDEMKAKTLTILESLELLPELLEIKCK